MEKRCAGLGIIFKTLFALILFLQSISLAYADNISEVKAAFERYVALEHAFDRAIVELYSDEAYIENTRHYPSGKKRKLVLTANQYKAILSASLPLAKTRKDYSTYSDLKFSDEVGGVRVTATRFSEMKKYESPISILFLKDKSDNWLIFEEISASKP